MLHRVLLLLSLVQSVLQSWLHHVTAVLTGTIRFAVVAAPGVTAALAGTIRFAVVAAPDVTAVLTGTIRFAVVAAPCNCCPHWYNPFCSRCCTM